ncbi:type II CRISPR RNA-guided endonuclease Cas9 [Succinimonas sp.]|uniref:type II CRISPR RNA-guided endonuclease Cas9 n=1 Tax=Succinimonas sp. TaxID=1936151 RepID=UPI00386956A6
MSEFTKNENGTKSKDWFIGLDIGTNSVGWCACDSEYNILTKNGKLQAGARLFEDAQDASKRREARSKRRRFARRHVRLELLREFFKNDIKDGFFLSLSESSFIKDDKTEHQKYTLFNDKDDNGNFVFTDAEYYQKFPTIFHLIEHLKNNDETDPRLLYLACHNLIKYRGHFLFNDFKMEDGSSNIKEIIQSINELLVESDFMTEENEIFNTNFNDLEFSAIFKIKKSTDQWLKISGTINNTNDKKLNNIINILKGNKISIEKLWPDNYKDSESDFKNKLKDFKFSSENFEECLSFAETLLNDNELSLIVELRKLYDILMFKRIIGSDSSLSEAMVHRYDKHQKDLSIFKKFIKEKIPDQYNEIFRKNGNYKDKKAKKENQASYVYYVGSGMTHDKKLISHNRMCTNTDVSASYEDFLKYVNTILEKNKTLSDNAEYRYIKDAVDNEDFCKKIRIKDNAYIPHQIKAHELKTILLRQKSNFPDILSDDSIEKIISLLTFRIPYYVGPLSDAHSDNPGSFSWVERTNPHSHVKITPWNFKDEIDLTRSGEKFIERMISKCTYLKDEYVIPMQSLLYQKYMVLNDLNNLKINGNRINHEFKTFLYENLCQSAHGNSLSKSKIKEFLVNNGKIDKQCMVGNEDENDRAFNSSLSSLIQFKNILNVSSLSKEDEEMCENIIKWHTVFGDEKDPVRERVEKNYKDKITSIQINKILKLNFKGWSRLSKKFLTEVAVHQRENEFSNETIMSVLEKRELNLTEILNSNNFRPSFLERVKEINSNNNVPKFNYDSLVKDLYCSPIVKRSIWQAVQICQELVDINKSKPAKIFIEVTRAQDKSKKGKMTTSRKEQLEALLKTAVRDSAEYDNIVSQLNEKQPNELKSDRLYLYFTQLGKCMYTGHPIRLEDLNNENLYDIDHIYPQSKIKDDSLNNRVLVERSANAKKTDNYPLSTEIRTKMKEFWEKLKDKKLISQEKFNRLICAQELTEDQIGGFINRQLVSTNQAVKETAKILEALFTKNVVYSKACLVSDFRQRRNHELVKCREINNLHHAHDAYLNIVVGNVWNSYYHDNFFSKNKITSEAAIDKLFIDKGDHRNIYWKQEYDQKIHEYLFNNKKYLNKFMVVQAPRERHGKFYDETIHPKGKGQYPLHESNNNKELWSVSKYGGYKGEIAAFLCCLSIITPDNREVRGLYPISIKNATKYRNNKAELLNQICLDNSIDTSIFKVKMIKDKILMFSVLEIDGIRYYIRSKDLQCSVDYEWYPNKEIIQFIHDIVKFKNRVASKEEDEPSEDFHDDIIYRTRKINPYKRESVTITKEMNIKVFDALIEQISKPIYREYSFAKAIKSGKISRSDFCNLGTYVQIIVLLNLLNNVAVHNGTLCNAKIIGGVENHHCKYEMQYKTTDIAKKLKNKKSNASHSIVLISKSFTGLYETRTPLISSDQ